MQNSCLKTSAWWSRGSHLLKMDICHWGFQIWKKWIFTSIERELHVSTPYEFLKRYDCDNWRGVKSSKILHKHLFSISLGMCKLPLRETENKKMNAYAKFWKDNNKYYGIFEKRPIKQKMTIFKSLRILACSWQSGHHVFLLINITFEGISLAVAGSFHWGVSIHVFRVNTSQVWA